MIEYSNIIRVILFPIQILIDKRNREKKARNKTKSSGLTCNCQKLGVSLYFLNSDKNEFPTNDFEVQFFKTHDGKEMIFGIISNSCLANTFHLSA